MTKKKQVKLNVGKVQEFSMNPRPLKEFERAPVIEAYMSSELGSLLQGAYLAMVDAFASANVRLTPTIYGRILPKQAFKLAVHLGAIDAATPEGEVGSIGGVILTPEFQHEMMAAIAPAIQYVRATVNNIPVKWREPTPPEHIEQFLTVTGWSKLKLYKQVSGTSDKQIVAATTQFVRRLCREPKPGLQYATDYRTSRKLMKLLTVMVNNAKEEFGSLTIDDLRWTPRAPQK